MYRETKDKPKHIKEDKYNDLIFENDTFSQGHIESNSEYKRPNIKTWAYSNMDNRDAWMTDSFFPIKINFNKDPFVKLRLYERGVVIIKTFDIKGKDFRDFDIVVKQVFNNYYIGETLRDQIIDNLVEVKSKMHGISSSKTVRLVHFIPEADLEHGYLKSFNNLISLDTPKFLESEYEQSTEPVSTVTTNKDEMTVKVIKELNDDSRSVKLNLSYCKCSNEDLIIDIFDTEITLSGCENEIGNEPGMRDHDALCVTTWEGNTHTSLGTFNRKELKELGFIKTEEEKLKDVRDVNKDLKELIVESLDKRFDDGMVTTKFMFEHSVSLHKLFSYIIREEGALLALEKEEISTAKEFIKLLGSLK